MSEPELKPESQKQCDPNSGCC
ncbi:MAG: hypothetical protein L0J60_06535 [Psychroflexus sp.]|nr:hypothetical protein [Psychroflexus sp.]